ncbi:MAG: CoA transferase [Gammaproteobacteria bacterium]|jgi:crotonobetainyl-CoA:carnitine CoA-transferase CaiB-like acyl-CoA transferase|nr:CoA transferase [Gammaproteobacteria bacterium]
MNQNESILGHIRVLDFGRYVAGPYCATLLGYLGAEVVRIERPEGGEDRYIAPVTAQGEGAVFMQTGCNKKSITLDLGHPAARPIIEKLVAGADVVVVNLPPASCRSLGLDLASLQRINPRIILATQTAFGEHGPYASRGGFDGVGQAMSGAMYITGTPGSPAKAAAPYVDYATAVLSAFGVLAALMERDRSGSGQQVSAALQATALAVFGSHLIEQGVTGINRVGTGNRVQTSAPSDVFATRDGHLLTHCVGNGLFKRWAKLMDRDNPGELTRWIDDARFQSDDGRGQNSEAILQRMHRWCSTRLTSDALRELDSAGIPAGPVYTPQSALEDPQAAAMRWFTPIEDYPGLPRSAPVPDLPLRFTRSQTGIRQRPPTLGEHTDAVLESLGFDAKQRDLWRADRVI